MIQELKIKNFLSFKEEVVFSFEATKDTTFEDYQVVEVAEGVRLLRFALVYGPNASGKTNLLDAFEFLRSFFSFSPDVLEEETGVINFRLDEDSMKKPTEFEMVFYIGGIKYTYALALTNEKVILEKLRVYNSVQPTTVFERNNDSFSSRIEFNPKVDKLSRVAIEEFNIKCLPNMSIFAARAKVNVLVPTFDKVRDWLKTYFMMPINPDVNISPYAEQRIFIDDYLKKYLKEFVSLADFNISDILFSQQVNKVPEALIDILIKNDEIPIEEKDRIRKEKSIKRVRTDFEHTVLTDKGLRQFVLPKDRQSAGTIRLLGIETALYHQIIEQSFLTVDELEASLHPDLMELVLKQYLGLKNNKSQLLITTHYDPLLNEIDDLFRRDSVWFTEKMENGQTNLYSLAEFKGLNRLSSFQRAYRNGLFGALPNIKN